MTTAQIVVATHKPYDLPPDPAYLPIHVGKNFSQVDLGYAGDDTGENISDRNATYCELTAMYWAWKNAPADVCGLAHYRRYFAGSGWRGVATAAEIESWMSANDVVVARPRRYYVETVRSHYGRAHHSEDLQVARSVIAEGSPEYLAAFELVMSQRHVSLYNMIIARQDHWDMYCRWLFPILDDCYTRIPWDNYGVQQRRVIGFLGERLLNVWLRHQSEHLRITTRPIVNLEREPIVMKGFKLLGRRVGVGKAD